MEKGYLKISENTVVHCPTKELAQKVLNVAGNLGYEWSGDRGYDLGLRWNIHKETTCLDLRVISFGDRPYFEEKGFKVISAEEFLKLHEDGVVKHAPTPIEENSAANIHSDEDYIKYKSVLSEAKTILNGGRQADYGDAVDNFKHIAAVVNAALRRDDITPDLCCMVHIATKLCREGNRHKRDNLVDLAAYSDIYNQIKERKNEKL